jgi:hypothetical protein
MTSVTPKQLVLVVGLVLTVGAVSSAYGQAPMSVPSGQLLPGTMLGTGREVRPSNALRMPNVASKPPFMTNVDSLRRKLESILKESPQQREKFAGIIQLLDVMDAKTVAQRHERIRRLPVTIRAWSGISAGRQGVWKEFMHRSGRSHRMFFPQNRDTSSGEQVGTLSEQPSHELVSEDAAPNSHGSSRLPWCQYTDINGVFWEGECATEQDMEDLAIMVASAQAEAESLESQAEEEINEYCQMLIVEDPEDPEYLEMCGDGSRDIPSSSLATFGGDESDEGLESGAPFMDPTPGVTCPDQSSDQQQLMIRCFLEKVTFGLAIAEIGFSVSYGLALIAAAASGNPIPLLAMGEAVSFFEAGILAAVVSWDHLQDCLHGS